MTKVENLLSRIDAMVEARLADALERAFGAIEPTRETERETPQRPQPVETPRRGVRPRVVGAQKFYRPITVRKGARKGSPIEPATEIPNGYRPVYTAIIKAWKGGKGKGLTAREIMTALPDVKPKQVESALWFLRQRAECIESVAVDAR